jgi:hypothetical protein
MKSVKAIVEQTDFRPAKRVRSKMDKAAEYSANLVYYLPVDFLWASLWRRSGMMSLEGLVEEAS